jgi:hypothetical protein
MILSTIVATLKRRSKDDSHGHDPVNLACWVHGTLPELRASVFIRIRGQSPLHDLARVRHQFKLTFGRCAGQLHQDPACVG